MALCSLEEGGLQLLFKTADLVAERWLGDMESRRCSPKVELLSDRDEIAHLTQLHGETHITMVSTLLEKVLDALLRPIAS